MKTPDQNAAALRGRTVALRQRLLDKVATSLSGEVLRSRSGALPNDIVPVKARAEALDRQPKNQP